MDVSHCPGWCLTFQRPEIRAINVLRNCDIAFGYWAIGERFNDRVGHESCARPHDNILESACLVCVFNFPSGVKVLSFFDGLNE